MSADIVTLKDKNNNTVYPQVTIDSLTGQVDDAPSAGSENLVKSGGISGFVENQSVYGIENVFSAFNLGNAIIKREHYVLKPGYRTRTWDWRSSSIHAYIEIPIRGFNPLKITLRGQIEGVEIPNVLIKRSDSSYKFNFRRV